MKSVFYVVDVFVGYLSISLVEWRNIEVENIVFVLNNIQKWSDYYKQK